MWDVMQMCCVLRVKLLDFQISRVEFDKQISPVCIRSSEFLVPRALACVGFHSGVDWQSVMEMGIDIYNIVHMFGMELQIVNAPLRAACVCARRAFRAERVPCSMSKRILI